MKISFDPGKDEWTRAERGFSLALGAEVIRNKVATFLDDQRLWRGSLRHLGYVEARLYVCVFTMRDTVFHLISVRKANDREIARYGR